MLAVMVLIIAAVAFAMYVTCPRMTAMIATEMKLSGLNPVLTISLGCILGIPMFLVLYYVLKNFGVEATVLLAAIFDVGAALLVGKLDTKAGVELLIITLFVYAGIKIAPLITNRLIPS